MKKLRRRPGHGNGDQGCDEEQYSHDLHTDLTATTSEPVDISREHRHESYFPANLGFRFSAYARSPSFASSL